MSRSDDDRFRIRPGAPEQRGDAFINQVLRQAGKAANATGGKRGKAPGARRRGIVGGRAAARGCDMTRDGCRFYMRIIRIDAI